MENGTIWLKPKPTHIDEYFEDFLNYLKSSGNAYDTLYTESLRLLKERVALLVEARTGAPMYRQDKAQEVLTFNTRLCGAWLLAVKDATMQERKLVLLTMINNLVCLCMQNTTTALNRSTFAYRAVNHKKPQTAKQHCNSAVYQHVTQIQTEHKGSYLRLTKYKESVLLGVLGWC